MDISQLILDRSVPDFIKEDYPLFQAFLKAYFEWLQVQKNSLDIVKNLRDYADIDRTLDEFIEHFRQQFATSIPYEMTVDRRLFLKNIGEFYKNKGNQASYKFLFRILYGSDLEFYYPKVDILRASDGKWQQQISIKIAKSDIPDISAIFNNQIYGETSNASAYVESVQTYMDRGIEIYELNLSDYRGAFQLNENIIIGQFTANLLEILSGIEIINGGSGYAVGEQVRLVDGSGTTIGSGSISAVGRGSVTGLNIVDGGMGYRGDFRQVEDFAYLPIGYTLLGDYLADNLLSTYELETISDPIPTQTLTDVGDIIRITDTPTLVGSGAIGKVILVTQQGEILDVELISGGQDYNIPVAEVETLTGNGAIIQATGGGGQINRTKLNDFPLFNPDTNGDDPLTIVINSTNGTFGNLAPIWGGTVARYPGNWINDDGFLSSTKVLQDSYYYQDFSYVLLSSISKKRWEELLGAIHPAGNAAFGRIKLVSYATMDAKIVQTTMQAV